MELSGLIFVALALVWAVVLLPKALRHHDELAQTRSVEGVSDGVRVLARREAVSDREARLVIPGSVAVPTASPANAPTAPTAAPTTARDAEALAPITPARVRSRIAAQRKAAGAAARRRRFILATLLVVALGIAVAAALGHLPLWSIGLPVAVTVAFLVSARLLVRRERTRWDAELRSLRSRVAEAAQSPSADAEPTVPPPSEESAPAPAETEVPTPVHNEQGLAVVSGLDDTASFPMGLLDAVAPTTDAGSLWDPLPMTLPTYVSKPRANRSVRTIDLNAPGVSSSGHDAASSALVADAATSAPPDDLPQRAVGS